MKSKERAADIGKAERRVLQPQVARKMSRMNAANKAKFEKQVQEEVEKIVYAAKRRYVRRQEKLDEAGVFHPEANAHRCILVFMPMKCPLFPSTPNVKSRRNQT